MAKEVKMMALMTRSEWWWIVVGDNMVVVRSGKKQSSMGSSGIDAPDSTDQERRG